MGYRTVNSNSLPAPIVNRHSKTLTAKLLPYLPKKKERMKHDRLCRIKPTMDPSGILKPHPQYLHSVAQNPLTYIALSKTNAFP